MTDDPKSFWWESIPKGKRVLLGFVKIDRADSTREWGELPPDEVLKRRRAYTAGVESIARAAGAAQPLNWQGDGVMLFFDDSVEPAPLQAFYVAQRLWERARFEINQDARIAVHAAEVAWDPERSPPWGHSWRRLRRIKRKGFAVARPRRCGLSRGMCARDSE
jgi:hypothetical protein